MVLLTALLAFAPLATLASPLATRATNTQIHPNGDLTQCLQFVGATSTSQPGNDSPLTIGLCTTPNAFNKFDIVFGDQQGIKLTGTNFCLDAGLPPMTGGPAKLYTCLTVPQQRWYYTADFHIAITGGNQCLDRKDGGSTGQTWNCVGGNTNQIWTIVSAPPVTTGQQLHQNGDTTKCLTVQPDQGVKANADVNVVTCADPASTTGKLQSWDLVRGSTAVKPHSDGTFCLDLVADVSGTLTKLQKCSGAASQKLFWTAPGDDHIAWEGGSTCLDARAGSGNPAGPSPYLARTQAWACAGSMGLRRR